MGTRGPEIFEDDVACDVRAAFIAALDAGSSVSVATERVLLKFQPHLHDIDDGPTVWFALALIQSELGLLQAGVRDRAVELIDAGEGLSRWEDAEPESLYARRQVLQTLKARLLSITVS